MFKNISNIMLKCVIILMLGNLPVGGQNLFTSRQGQVSITFKYVDTILTASSNSVLIKLNYSEAQIDLILDTRDIDTGIDSLNTILYESNKTLHLFAALKLDYIDTKKHPIQNFTLDGTLYHYLTNSFTKKKIISLNGKGKLEHISEIDNFPACLLTLNFELLPQNVKVSYPFSLMKDFIRVEIIQSILKSNLK